MTTRTNITYMKDMWLRDRDVSMRMDNICLWVGFPSPDCGVMELWKAFTSQEQVALHQRASHCHWRTDKGNSCRLLAAFLLPLSGCIKLRGVITAFWSACVLTTFVQILIPGSGIDFYPVSKKQQDKNIQTQERIRNVLEMSLTALYCR